MSQTKTESATLVKQKEKYQPPKKWKVIFHNDDVTTVTFVVKVLITIFEKSPTEAESITWKVHYRGKAVAGIYTKEIAETKLVETITQARACKFPLVLTMEEC